MQAVETRKRDSSVLDAIKNFGCKSARKISDITGISKDKAQRALNALRRRHVYPEAKLWETDLAQEWLHRMMIAAITTFVLEGGVGADRLSVFFHRVRLEKEIGVSPSALRTQIVEVEKLVARYGTEQETVNKEKIKEIIVGGDETFFREKLILVLMELSSGYLLLEEFREERTFTTWQDAVSKRLGELGCEVRMFTSDRGKSLIKLALEEFGCDAGADLFHAQQDLSRWQGLVFKRKIDKADKAVKDAQEKLNAIDKKQIKGRSRKQAEQKLEQACGTQYKHRQGQKKFRAALHGISKVLHPFSPEGGIQSSTEVTCELNTQLETLAQVSELHNIPDRRGVMDKFRRQLKDLTGRVNAWWLWADESLEALRLDAGCKTWAKESLLPVIYWSYQVGRTDNPELREIYSNAHKVALHAWKNHPVTKNIPQETLDNCQRWAETMTMRFQRSSSAIEGRNGCLAQMYHSTRGLSTCRLKALTVLHNFACRRRDGTTPAERLFGTGFPDIFEWVVERSGPLPLPRKARQKKSYDPLDRKPLTGGLVAA